MHLKPKLTPQQQAVFNAIEPDLKAGDGEIKAGRPEAAVILFERAVQRLPQNFPYRFEIWQKVIYACKEAILLHVKPGAENAGDAWIRIALSCPDLPENATSELKLLRAQVFNVIGLHLIHHRRFELAVAFERKGLAASPSSGLRLNLTHALFYAGKRAILSDFTPAITPDQLAPQLLVACTPKSGSSFLYQILIRLTGWKEVRGFAPAGQFEQELYTPNLIEYATIPGIMQQHCRATEANLQILEAFRIPAVVLVRNFADSLVSLTDFYRSGAHETTLFRQDFPSLPRETQIDLLLEHRMPWYFEFVASWQLAERTRRLPICWVTYEELFADKIGTVRRMMNFWKLKASDEQIKKAIDEAGGDHKKIRLNVGRSGRGRDVLTPQQLERLASYARFFPSTDFSKVGLGPPLQTPATEPPATAEPAVAFAPPAG